MRDVPPVFDALRLRVGEAVAIREGIWSLRLPLPSKLGHVNAYVLDDGDGWTAVDCGYDTPEIREIWDRALAGVFGNRRLRRVITTHGHTDHVGAVMHLLRKQDAAYETTLIEWQSARLRSIPVGDDETVYTRFALLHGCDGETVERFIGTQRGVTRYLGEQPSCFGRISDKARVDIGGRTWVALVTGGHAEGHVSFYCEAERILLAGDQILPEISPLIPVSPHEPDGNPLGAFLESLEQFKLLPEDTLVLPGHGGPFQRLGRRCVSIAEHHRQRLARISEMIGSPRTAFDVATLLFGQARMDTQGRLALSETVAHLNHLMASGNAARTEDSRGVLIFSARGELFDPRL